MKNNHKSTIMGLSEPALEAKIQTRAEFIKKEAINDAEMFARRNQPAPVGGSLQSFIDETRAKFSMLASETIANIQPSAEVNDARMEADYYNNKDKHLDAEILELRQKNDRDCYEMGNERNQGLSKRINISIGASLLIMIGEVAINSQALQVTGGSLLSSFGLALSLSIAVVFFSHLIGFWYKKTRSRLKRRLLFFGSLLLVSGVFVSVAILRSLFLAKFGVILNPFYFSIFNIFFYLVSFLISIFIFPSWEELKEGWRKMKIQKEISKREKQIQEINIQKDKLRIECLQVNKHRCRKLLLVRHYMDLIQKHYLEAVEGFKRHNIIYRTDGNIPECFLNSPALLEIDYSSLPLISQHKRS